MKQFNYNFVSKFKLAVILSLTVVGLSIALLIGKGLNFGVDFRGGAEIQVKFFEPTGLDVLRKSLNDAGYKASSVQSLGEESQNEFIIKVGATEEDINKVSEGISKQLATDFPDKFEIRKTDIVGPKAGEQLKISGFQAMFYALMGIMLYIWLRFDFKYAPGAIVALFHDVIIILGVFALTQFEFSLQIVAALLAIIGYSVNDTVVVYDRVRENEEKDPQAKLSKTINRSLNETLTRTIMTSLTTLAVSAIMYAMGGGVIKDFFFAISFGVIVGTYSSIFIAAPTVLFLDKVQASK